MKKARARVAAVLTASTALLLSCATTTFQSTWRNPEARPLQLTGKKVLAVFVHSDSTLRRNVEDAMAGEILARGAQGVPAYTVLSDHDVRDRETAKAKAEQLGFQGAVVLRIVGSQTQYTFEPDFWGRPYYRHMWGGYWGWGWGAVYEPGYLREDQVVKAETLVYSLEQDQLVWAGVSRTFNPSETRSFVRELAAAVTGEMTKSGLLPPAKPA